MVPAQCAEQGPRGRILPRRLRRQGVLLLPGHPRAADRARGARGLRGPPRWLRPLLRDHRRPGRRLAGRGHRDVRPGVAHQAPTFETVDVDYDDTAVILYTSGTTGQPKGAELPHRNMFYNAWAAGRCSALTRPARHRPGVLPLFHSFGQTVIQNGGFAHGGTVVLLPRFEAVARPEDDGRRGRDVLRRRPHHVLGPARRAAPSRRRRPRWPTCGSRCPAGRRCRSRSHQEFEKQFGVTILEGYGLSETSPVASFTSRGQEVRVGLHRLSRSPAWR